MKGVGRNDPCPCRSGKKYKRCCINKRSRDQYVYIGHREPFQGIVYEDGQVSALLSSGEKVKADALFSQTQYVRTSGKDKVVSRILNEASFDLPLSLASRFDSVWAIDTNTKRVGGDLVSTSGILECHTRKATATQVHVSCRGHVIAFKNCPNGEAERCAWSKLVTVITSSPTYSVNLRIGIITDHDLARHSAYNSRELPIYSDTYLPENFTLVYASSDVGPANVLNQLVIECHKAADEILRQFEKGGSVTIGNSIVTVRAIPDLSTC
jgi:hypothetical protein